MEYTVAKFLQKTLNKIPVSGLRRILEEWDFLSPAQLRSLDSAKYGPALRLKVLALCEENHVQTKHVIELDMIYNHAYSTKRNWSVFQFYEQQELTYTMKVTEFVEQFTANLKQLTSHVSVVIKQFEDDALLIRVAWGDNFKRPNHFFPTYAVYHPHSPYVFISHLGIKQRPLLLQALLIAAKYTDIKEIQLKGRCLKSLRDLVMRHFKPIPCPKASQEISASHPNITNEHAKHQAYLKLVADDAFGEGTLPLLETAVFKLETKFKDPVNRILENKTDPFRCVIKFSSPNLLESLKSSVELGIVNGALSPLLTSISLKARNHFVIKERMPTNAPGP
ncbi:centromere protein N [Erpetoichthys calabaricus]|uniref:Centromere protein N n=1 Tax=Erpetoichthys calabaricus TaxID=27687 RepID=A0A8C4SZU0_ERPCA|nr:centromere protein N [Erpetoichthys calabaricus]